MSRNPIQDHFVILCSKLNLEKLLPYLKQERMVTTDEYEMLTNPNFTARQKREKLLIWLPRKGRNYFTNFGKCLVWSGQTELARHIGVDVALVPEAPFKLPEDEPSPQEQQQQLFNLLQTMMSSTQQPPPPAAIPHPSSVPGSTHTVSHGVSGVSAPPSKVHQPSTTSGVHFLLPSSSHGSSHHVPTSGPAPHTVPPPVQPEPMDVGGPVPPQHLRPDRHVLRASTANEEVTTAVQTKGQVFILYCKDDKLPATFSEDVLDLADTLNLCGGFECTVDHYIDVPPANWNSWTQHKIEESQYVILVYSPTLAQMINSRTAPHDNTVNMEKGKYYVNTIVNLIHPPKFIPVCLNNHLPANGVQWLPPQLRMYAIYNLNISQLREALHVPDGTPRYVFEQKLFKALHDDHFREVAKLVHHLRSESDTQPPLPPENPIRVPTSVHNPASHHVAQAPTGELQQSHVAHPQSEMAVYHQQQLHIAHPVSELQQLVDESSMQHSGGHVTENSVQSFTSDSLHLVQPIQSQEEMESEYIGDVTLKQIGLRLKQKWFDLGTRLGVDDDVLEDIQKNLQHVTDYQDAAPKMINAWRSTKRERATIQVLKQALVDIGYGHVAQEFFQDD